MSTRIELSKLFSIEIDGDMNVIDCICNWDSDNDDISIYSEEISVVSDEKELDADMIQIYNEDGDIDTDFYIVHLFDPNLLPSKNKRKNRKSKNKMGDWCYILFSSENFDAEINCELGNNTTTVDINNLITYENIKYSNIKLSEFLKTEKANYIRSLDAHFNPRDPRYDWQT